MQGERALAGVAIKSANRPHVVRAEGEIVYAHCCESWADGRLACSTWRRVWTGEYVNFEGEQLHLTNAACTPAPIAPPRVVVGAGSSRRLIRSAVEYADEINVYASEELIRFARQEIEASGRAIGLSVFVWDWPKDIAASLAAWEQLGVERTFLTFWQTFDNIESAVQYLS